MLRSESTHHMYSAIIFSVVSERFKLRRSESRDMFGKKENMKRKSKWEREIELFCFMLGREERREYGRKQKPGSYRVVVRFGRWKNI